MQEIADELQCSVNRVVYWMRRHGIKRRTWSEATYRKRNPDGDPFKLKLPKTMQEAKLYGLGVGLYWGEGTKSNKHSIRLGNTDPKLLLAFIDFLETFFEIKREDLKFELQIFTDIDKNEALDYWINRLGLSSDQFGKPVVTISGSIGTYRKKSQYGVVTVVYHNIKARDHLIGMLPM